MKKLSIKDFRGKSIELNFGSLTQMLGYDGEKKEYIIESLRKFFSKYKYDDSEDYYTNNVSIDDMEIGRNYFQTHYASNLSDIEDDLKNAKSTMLNEYLLKQINDFDLSNLVDQFNEYIDLIIEKINRGVSIESLDVVLSVKPYGIEDVIKNNLKISFEDHEQKNLNYISNYKKILCFLELIEKLNQINPKKRLIILNNIDRYIKQNEFLRIMELMELKSKENDFFYVVSSSIEGYCYLNPFILQTINVINDTTYSFPPMEIFRKYVENHYPYYKKIDTNDLLDKLKPVIHKIGSKENYLNIESQVILKILNESEKTINRGILIPNILELKYIQEKQKMV
ncbi:MAG: hypothetical protein JXQ26_08655 [Tissierellales bacterium]|nr:hypothetical protein [Tissierellales bacterium]MBN2828048.1 hypothetical protein [Tissierellales bacterium]